MTGIILAGGRGTRLKNKDKALIKIGEFTIIERIIIKLKEAGFEEIIICRGQNLNCKLNTQFAIQSLTFIKDIIPHKGPLVGLYSGLRASNSFYNFVVGCDMPFLSPNLIKYMKNKVGDADIVIPKTKEGIEPLYGIYSKNCLEIIKQKIEEGNDKLSVHSIIREVKTKYIEEEEIRQFSFPKIVFFNINTEEDIKRAKRLANELVE